MLRAQRFSAAVVGISALSLGLLGLGVGLPTAAVADTSTTYYFHGGPTDDASRANGAPTATYDGSAPTGTTGAIQTAAPGAVPAPYWIGTAVPKGSYATGFSVTTYWSSENAEDFVLGLDLDISVYTDATVTKSGVSGTLLAATDPNHPANFSGISPSPSAFTVTLNCRGYDAKGGCTTPAGGYVGSNLVVVAAPHFTDTGQSAQVHYDSTSALSSFTVTTGTPTGGGNVDVPSCNGAFCFSAPVVLPDSDHSGNSNLADPCYNTCGEPSLAVSPVDGTLYVSTPRTIVVCCNTQPSPVWESSDNGRTWSRPIYPSGAEHATTGGDTELAVDKRGTVYEGELWLGSDSIYISSDKGSTWDWSPASHDVGADREWFAYSPQEDALYGWYDGFKGLMVAKAPLNTPLGSQTARFFPQERVVVPECAAALAVNCPDPGVDSVAGTPIIPSAVSPGRPSVSPVDGTLYFPFPYQVAGKGIGIASTTDGLNFTYNYVTGAGKGVLGDTGNDFPVSAVDASGRLYVAWVENRCTDSGQTPCYDVYLASSGDKGATWTTPLKVSNGISRTAVFPNIVAGAAGQVAVSWYGTDVQGDMNTVPDDTSWNVYVTQVTNAASATPSLTTDDVQQGFHHGVICTQGAACTGSTRNLLDFFDMKFDQTGNLGVVYTRDVGPNANHTAIAYSYQTGGCVLTSATCALGTAVPEFPSQAVPVALGGLLIGSLVFLRSRSRRPIRPN